MAITQSPELKAKINLLKVGDVVKIEMEVFEMEATFVGEIEEVLSLPLVSTGRLYRLKGEIFPIPSELIQDVILYVEKEGQ